MKTLRFQNALTPRGLRPVQLHVDDKGLITAVEEISQGPWDGWLALPGMVNAHSHSFQRIMCGYAEAAVGEQSFWGWRELMYRVAQRITPRDQFVIARRAFREMLAAGFTTVAEFHYLHHNVDGSPGTAMAEAVIEAAAETGIRLVLLPVFYQRGGFDEPAGALQRRFVHDSADAFLAMVEQLGSSVGGIAPHSVRAVDPAVLPELVAGARSLLGEQAVVHLHVAEQPAEVTQARAATGRSPVALLFHHCEPDERWSFVHATHVDRTEPGLLRAAGITVVLCPLTEANLGDGVFPAAEFAGAGGHMAIGSDCNARIDAVSELRLLEYGQRLTLRRRGVLADEDGLGGRLWGRAAAAGARSTGLAAGRLETGALADLVVLAPTGPLDGLPPARALDALLVGGDGRNVAEVYVGGRRVDLSPRPDRHFAEAVRRLCAGAQ